jgi:hypothetical protein
MNLELVEKIAKAVLYEGYMLYPYRPSAVKNRQRWNFGVLLPRSYSETQTGSDTWFMQTECLVRDAEHGALEVKVRFLQLVERTVERLPAPLGERHSGEMPAFEAVDKFEVDGKILQPWQEAVEREISLPVRHLENLAREPLLELFNLPADREVEPVHDAQGRVAGIIVRQREPISGTISVSAARLSGGIFKTCVRICNETQFESSEHASREQALRRSLVSTHTIMGVRDGSFTSSVDPPDAVCELASGCHNIGTWPVLVGKEEQHDTMLSSPIILYDYPQIAAESCGDLFDGTEIDEILSLRILTLTDEEKREMRQSDERARQLLERTETLPAEQFMKLHGVLRGLRPLEEDTR